MATSTATKDTKNTASTPAPAKAVKPTAAPAKPQKSPTLKTPVDVLVLLMNGTNGSTFQVHLKGCKSYNAAKTRSEYKGLEDYSIEGVFNRRTVIMEAWDDQVREGYTDDPDTDDDYAGATWAWLAKNGYVDATEFHTCLAGLPQSSKAAAKATESIKKVTRQELATRVAESAAVLLDQIFALAATPEDQDDPDSDDAETRQFAEDLIKTFGSEDAARQCVAQWMHGMPVDRDRWYNAGLPIPQRSDWAGYTPPAADTASTEAAE